MEYIKGYVSDDSLHECSGEKISGLNSDSSIEQKIKDDSHAFNISENAADYFNLTANDSDEECEQSKPKKKCLNSYELVEKAKLLSEKEYGPCLRDTFNSKINPTALVPKTSFNMNVKKRTFHECLGALDPKSSRLLNCNKLQYTSNEKNSIVGSSQESEKETLNSSPVYSMFNIKRINNAIAQERLCHIPKQIVRSYSAHSSAVSSLQWCKEQYSHLLLSCSIGTVIKVWDMFVNNVVQEIEIGSSVKSAKWSLCGTKAICGGFGKTAHVIDVKSGKQILSYSVSDYISSLQLHPGLEDVFLVGTRNNVFAFDNREPSLSPIRSYTSNCQNVLDISFLNEGKEFVCSTEVVSRDCADRTIMAWDFATGALLSNQIYPECYTCPCLKVEPGGKYFIAQSNGDYIAIFSTKRPFKMNKNKRYTGHKVAGYAIGCDFSLDGNFLASGDAEGGLYIYHTENCNLFKVFSIQQNIPTVQVTWHPVLHSTIATATWDGSIQIWH